MKLSFPADDRALGGTRTQQIQNWIGSLGGSIGNAYRVNEKPLAAMGAKRGVIEKILWRLGKSKPEMQLTPDALLKILEPDTLIKEVRKQMKIDSKEHGLHEAAFRQTRLQLIRSKLGKEAPDKRVKDVEQWFANKLPEMRDTRSILGAVDLFVESDGKAAPLFVPRLTTPEQIAKLGKTSPGRVYIDETGEALLLLKPGERAVVENDQLRIEAPELKTGVSSGAPEMTL